MVFSLIYAFNNQVELKSRQIAFVPDIGKEIVKFSISCTIIFFSEYNVSKADRIFVKLIFRKKNQARLHCDYYLNLLYL